MFCSASSPPDLNPFEHVFHLLKAKLSKQELKTALKKKKKERPDRTSPGKKPRIW